jgi:hypothetical protein
MACFQPIFFPENRDNTAFRRPVDRMTIENMLVRRGGRSVDDQAGGSDGTECRMSLLARVRFRGQRFAFRGATLVRGPVGNDATSNKVSRRILRETSAPEVRSADLNAVRRGRPRLAAPANDIARRRRGEVRCIEDEWQQFANHRTLESRTLLPASEASPTQSCHAIHSASCCDDALKMVECNTSRITQSRPFQQRAYEY